MSEVVKSKKTSKKEVQTLLRKKEEEIHVLQREKNEYVDKWQRALAELENYRKRKEKEEENIRKYALESILYELLGVVDNFERALQTIEDVHCYKRLEINRTSKRNFRLQRLMDHRMQN